MFLRLFSLAGLGAHMALHMSLLALIAPLAGAAAQAQEAKSATPAPLKPPTVAAAPVAVAPAPAMSESKFLGALYSEITKRTPEASPAGAGEVTASFHVNASGKVDRVAIDKATSPALAEAVKKILAEVSAPPPPGGSMDIGQTFKFH